MNLTQALSIIEERERIAQDFDAKPVRKAPRRFHFGAPSKQLDTPTPRPVVVRQRNRKPL